MAAGVMRWPSDVTLFFRENGIALEKAQRQHREGHGRSLNPTPVGSATRNRVPQSGSAIGFRNRVPQSTPIKPVIHHQIRPVPIIALSSALGSSSSVSKGFYN